MIRNQIKMRITLNALIYLLIVATTGFAKDDVKIGDTFSISSQQPIPESPPNTKWKIVGIDTTLPRNPNDAPALKLELIAGVERGELWEDNPNFGILGGVIGSIDNFQRWYMGFESMRGQPIFVTFTKRNSISLTAPVPPCPPGYMWRIVGHRQSGLPADLDLVAEKHEPIGMDDPRFGVIGGFIPGRIEGNRWRYMNFQNGVPTFMPERLMWEGHVERYRVGMLRAASSFSDLPSFGKVLDKYYRWVPGLYNARDYGTSLREGEGVYTLIHTKEGLSRGALNEFDATLMYWERWSSPCEKVMN